VTRVCPIHEAGIALYRRSWSTAKRFGRDGGFLVPDWLGYGLELAYTDSPEIGILRRHRTNSGLIRTEVRGEYLDWPQAVHELIAGQKPKFVLMMVGINDRRQFRETGQTTQALRAGSRHRGRAAGEAGNPPSRDAATVRLCVCAVDAST
jgi:hypothetical protein